MPETKGRLPAQIVRQERAGGRAHRALPFLLFAAGLVFALIAWSKGDSFYLRLATEALIFAGLAISVDVLLGYTGLLSLGQALYFGLGAYVSALALKDLHASFWDALALALFASTVVGLVGAVIANRVRGVYFALITFGMAQIVAKVVYNLRVLGASDGITGIPNIKADFLLFGVASGDPVAFFLLVLAITFLIYVGTAYLMDTPFGRTLLAIKANEARLRFLGYDTRRYKILAFVLAADVAALSGALYPMLRGFVSPELMFFGTSGNAVITVIIGGTGTLLGPILGSILLTVVKSVLGSYTEHHLILIGVLFMLSVIFLPRGILGLLRPQLNRTSARSGARP